MSHIALMIPTYNSASTIGETLVSIQVQGDELRRISAVYLADDGSQDETVAVAEAMWSAMTPLRVLKYDENLGERGNVNRAMRKIQGSADWILLLHSDDLAKPLWLPLMLARIDSAADQVGSLCSSWDTLMPGSAIVRGEDDPERTIEIIEGTPESVRGALKRGCWWHISGCAIRMKTFIDVGEFNPSLPQLGDWEWLLRCLNAGWNVEYIPRALTVYRQHEASVSSASFRGNKDILESLEIARANMKFLSNTEMLLFHGRRLMALGRRFVRSVLNLQLRRCFLHIRTATAVGRSVLQTRRANRGVLLFCKVLLF